MFDLKRPCVDCPFRRGVGRNFQLGRARVKEIVEAVSFQCHKTVDYEKNWKGDPGNRPQQCAGLMAVLAREGRPNQIMQVAVRLGNLDLTTLDPEGEAYEGLAEVMIDHD